MALNVPTGDPYRLAGARLPFTSWHYVRPAAAGWYDSDGARLALDASVELGEAIKTRQPDDPWGVELIVRPAERVGPLIPPEEPWEEGGAGLTTVFRDSGIYRGWGSTGWGDLERGVNLVCYWESDDGYSWRRVHIGDVNFKGRRDNNLLNLSPGGTVFQDPSSPEHERYKWISTARISRAEWERFDDEWPGQRDPRAFRDEAHQYGVVGAVSSDGLSWTGLDRPLAVLHSDTQVVAYFDAPLGRYVAYFRDWAVGRQADGFHEEHPTRWLSVGRRAIGRAESEGFGHFPMSEIVLEPRWTSSPSEVLYTNCKTTIPEAPDSHLMFPTVWDTVSDTTYLDLAVSSDGKSWQFAGSGGLLSTSPWGQWDGGCVFASPNLIELPNGDYALPYQGYDVPHKYPRTEATRGAGYAVWRQGRLAGIRATERGGFTTVAVLAPGLRVSMNAGTLRAGSIRVEAAGLDGTPIPGREFANSVRIVGNSRKHPVRWKGHDDIGVGVGEPIILRVELDMADLYHIDWI